MTVDAFWKEYLLSARENATERYRESFCFGPGEGLANELVRLVLEGKKRATTSCLAAYELEGSPLPQAGELSVVTDFSGEPRCVIETLAVTVLPFCEMSFEMCSREGEDETLESWRENHMRVFTAEGRELGYEFSPDMPVVFEDFKLIYKRAGSP